MARRRSATGRRIIRLDLPTSSKPVGLIWWMIGPTPGMTKTIHGMQHRPVAQVDEMRRDEGERGRRNVGVPRVWVRERGAARAGACVHPAQPYCMCIRGTEQRSVEGDHVHVDLVRVGVQGLVESEDEREEGREEDVTPHHGVDLTIACKRVVHAQVSTCAVRHGGTELARAAGRGTIVVVAGPHAARPAPRQVRAPHPLVPCEDEVGQEPGE